MSLFFTTKPNSATQFRVRASYFKAACFCIVIRNGCHSNTNQREETGRGTIVAACEHFRIIHNQICDELILFHYLGVQIIDILVRCSVNKLVDTLATLVFCNA